MLPRFSKMANIPWQLISGPWFILITKSNLNWRDLGQDESKFLDLLMHKNPTRRPKAKAALQKVIRFEQNYLKQLVPPSFKKAEGTEEKLNMKEIALYWKPKWACVKLTPKGAGLQIDKFSSCTYIFTRYILSNFYLGVCTSWENFFPYPELRECASWVIEFPPVDFNNLKNIWKYCPGTTFVFTHLRSPPCPCWVEFTDDTMKC